MALRSETYHIKGMCCARCVRAAREELSKLDLKSLDVRIGEVQVEYDGGKVSREQIQEAIEDAGFEIMTLLKEQKIEEIKQYVRDHISDPETLRLSAISRAMAVSPFHLSRTFSLMEDETLQEFIARARMEKAAQLLRDTERTVLDISVEIGFSSTSHFSKQFKKQFGLTPVAYRKDSSGGKEPLVLPKTEGHLEEGQVHVHDEVVERCAPIHGRHFSKKKG